MIDVNKSKLSAKEQNIVMVLNELILNSQQDTWTAAG